MLKSLYLVCIISIYATIKNSNTYIFLHNVYIIKYVYGGDYVDFYMQYKDQFDLLLQDENNINFFCEILEKEYNTGSKTFKSNLDSIMSFIAKNNLHIAEAWLNNYYCWYYYYAENNYAKAIKLALDSYNTLEKYGCKVGMVHLCNGLMAFYSKIGQIELSNEWGLKGITMAEEINDNHLLLILLINITIGYMELDNFMRAKEICDYIELKEFELSPHINICFNQCKAEIEINIGDANKALDIIHDIYSFENDPTCSYLVSDAKKLEAMAYAKLLDYDKAEKLFIEAYDYANKLNQEDDLCSILARWSDMYCVMGESEKAIEKIHNFLPIAQKNDEYTLLIKYYYKLYLLYKKIGKINESLYYLEQYTAVDEKVYNFQSSHWMAKLEASHSEREANLYKILYDKTSLLSSIGQEIISNLNETDVLKIITREIHKLMKADMFGISLYDDVNKQFTYRYIDKQMDDIKNCGPFSLDIDSYTSYCIKNNKDLLIKNNDIECEKFNIKHDDENYPSTYMSLLYSPMVIKDRIIGVLTVQAKDKEIYKRNDLNTLKILSNYVAIAMENAACYKKMEKIAIYDNLTGFLSRREILKIGTEALKQCRINNEKMCIAMIDVDDFKDVTQTHSQSS